MDTIDIVKFPPYASNETLQVLSYHLDRECNRITLKEVNWPDTYPYRPDIHFRIAYNEQHIFLKFDGLRTRVGRFLRGTFHPIERWGRILQYRNQCDRYNLMRLRYG